MGNKVKIKKEVIVEANAKTDNATNKLNALTNVLGNVGSAYMNLISINYRMTQSNIAVRDSVWGIVDAKRAQTRLSLQHLELDLEQVKLNAQLADRTLNLTQRTGRYLDVQNAMLSQKKANYAIALMEHDIMVQEDTVRRQNIKSTENYALAIKAQELMMKGLYIQTTLMIAQTTIMLGLLLTELATRMGIAFLKNPLVGAAIGAAAVGAGIWAVGEIKEAGKMKVPSAQTEVGEVKKITKSGLVNMHEGEVHTPSNNFNEGNTTVMFNIQGNMDRDTMDFAEREFVRLGTYRRTMGI